MKWIIWIILGIIFGLASVFISICIDDVQASPVLHFSDLISGPDTGVGDGLGSGTIVTVWGNNLGSSQGTSKIYFEDSTTTAREAAYVYYWRNATGELPGGPADLYTTHKMQEIAFSIPDSATGAGTIYVDVGGVESNTLAFTVQAGDIFYISSTGSGSNDGSWATPWSAMDYPTSNSVCNQASFGAGDIVYAKDSMTETDAALRYKIGTLTNRCALVSYPNGRYTTTGGGISNNYPYDHDYWIISKCSIASDTNGISPGVGWRMVGNKITDISGADGQGGAISGSTGLAGNDEIPLYCFGNYIHDFGYSGTSSLHHVFYLSNRNRNHVIGSDGNVYMCKTDHTSSSSTAPITGGSWEAYWELSTMDSGYSTNWADATAYDDGKIYGYELGWNRLEDNMARNGLHVYDETRCGDYLSDISVHDNWVRNQAGASIAVGTLGAYTDSPCISVDVYIYNNIIVNAGQDPFAGWGSIYIYGDSFTGDAYVYNNTVYGDQTTTGSTANVITVPGATWSSDYPYGGDWHFVNNALYDTDDTQWENPTAANKVPATHTNNLWYDGGDNNPTDPPSWDTTPLESDPSFVSNGTDFNLQSDSPCVGAGANLSGTLTYDFYGNTRSAWDIGAAEYGTVQSQLRQIAGGVLVQVAGGSLTQ